MPWSGCSTTSEFIELLNFGPGPMDIGCYTVTNGQYSVTIPPNTVLQPRQYFLLAGQNTLAKNCGNVDSAVTVNLNWTTCNCTNTPIPTTGDGFLQNGGSANEKIVLLDRSLNVVDAVSRNAMPGSSTTITTSTVSGGCVGQTFNLSAMSVAYEIVSSSSGIDNSFSRKVDGDCGWVKTTQVSARAPNKTGGTSSADYQFSTLSASECTGTTGSISINVSADNVASLFPMNYTLAYDADSNGKFESTDHYLQGVDSTASTIDIKKLVYGRYRITVGSSSGCNLKTFDFFIFNCYGVVLPVKLKSFTYKAISGDNYIFDYALTDPENVQSLVLEGGDGGNFQPLKTIKGPLHFSTGEINIPVSPFSSYRLKVVDKLDNTTYSPIVRTPVKTTQNKLWKDPASNKLIIELGKTENDVSYTIMNAAGFSVASGKLQSGGQNRHALSIAGLNKGIYFLKLVGKETTASFKFNK